MFREMRRKRQELPPNLCEEILRRGTSGVLAVLGDEGYPYAVPLSYVHADGKVFFHCAKAGHKLDAISKTDKASFCVIDCDQVVPEEYTSYFRSVIVFGRVRVLDDDKEKREAIELLAQKYAPQDGEANRNRAIDREWKPLCMLEMTIEHMTGKEAIEFIRRRDQV